MGLLNSKSTNEEYEILVTRPTKLTNEEYENYIKNKILTLELKTMNKIINNTFTLDNINNELFHFLFEWNVMMETKPIASNYFYFEDNEIKKIVNHYNKSITSLSLHIQLNGLNKNCYILLTDQQQSLINVFKNMINKTNKIDPIKLN